VRKNHAISRFLTPPEIKYQPLHSTGHGYGREAVDELIADIVDSYQRVWRERDDLKARVEQLESELRAQLESGQALQDRLTRAAADLSFARATTAKRDADASSNRARGFAEEPSHAAADEQALLETEVERLRVLADELRAGLRALLVAGLELVESAEPPRDTQPEP
jgi:cell division septum initiation protein DivIVA